MNTIKYCYSFHLLIIIIFIILPVNSNGYILNSINNNNNNNNSIKQNSTTNVIKNLDDSAKITYTNLFGTSSISESAEEGRTFARIKKLQMSLLPIMFILGVKSTVLLLVLALSIKSVGIGLILLMMNIGFIIAKFVALFKLKEDHHPHGYSDHHGGWQPEWAPPTAQNKEIHLHIHNDDKHKHTSYEPYGSYSSNNGHIYVGPPSARNYQIDKGGWLTSLNTNNRKKSMINDFDDYDPVENYLTYLYGN